MHQAEIIVLLLTAVGVLAVLAHKITLPYPIVLVLGGLALSFVPRLPTVSLNPGRCVLLYSSGADLFCGVVHIVA